MPCGREGTSGATRGKYIRTPPTQRYMTEYKLPWLVQMDPQNGTGPTREKQSVTRNCTLRTEVFVAKLRLHPRLPPHSPVSVASKHLTNGDSRSLFASLLPPICDLCFFFLYCCFRGFFLSFSLYQGHTWMYGCAHRSLPGHLTCLGKLGACCFHEGWMQVTSVRGILRCYTYYRLWRWFSGGSAGRAYE